MTAKIQPMSILIGSIATPGAPLAGISGINGQHLEPQGFGFVPEKLFQLGECPAV